MRLGRSTKQRLFWLALVIFVGGLAATPQPRTARTRLADGFDQPVGKPDAEGYYMSRGFRANYHMGEDWNGMGGGNTDLGDPVYATANGFVVMARDVRMGWGNLVIIRHAFLESGRLNFVDSVYAHLQDVTVREGQQVVRGQKVGTIGNNRGMYTAHLHFEIRKNLHIGFNQRGFPRDLSAYHVPGRFISPRRQLPGSGRSALVPVGTFQMPRSIPFSAPLGAEGMHAPSSRPTPDAKLPFRVNRFEDL